MTDSSGPESELRVVSFGEAALTDCRVDLTELLRRDLLPWAGCSGAISCETLCLDLLDSGFTSVGSLSRTGVSDCSDL